MAFTFKQFHCDDKRCGMKISTDGVLLGAWAGCSGKKHIADIGAGSGLISLMLAQRFPESKIAAIEIDPDACDDARDNIAASKWAEHIDVHCCDFSVWQKSLSTKFDALVSNPPFFISELHSPTASRALARHSDSGLSYGALIDLASKSLNDDGILAMILPAEFEDDVIFHAELNKLKLHRLCRVHSNTNKPALRILIELGNKDIPQQISRLDIYDEQGQYTSEYQELTHEFYLKF